jgi:hypothetical protein
MEPALQCLESATEDDHRCRIAFRCERCGPNVEEQGCEGPELGCADVDERAAGEVSVEACTVQPDCAIYRARRLTECLAANCPDQCVDY